MDVENRVTEAEFYAPSSFANGDTCRGILVSFENVLPTPTMRSYHSRASFPMARERFRR